MEKLLRILMVEDIPTDAELIIHEITRSGIDFIHRVVETKQDYIMALQEFKPDIILSDYSLPRFDGMQALMIRQEMVPFVPFILVTGSINEETAVKVMKAGADDYVIKEHITRIGSAIKTTLEKREIILAKQETEEKLQILSRAVEQNPATILITNTEGDIEYVNPKFTEITGYTFDEVVGKNPRILKSGNISSGVYSKLWKTIIAGGEWRGEFQNKKKNGELYYESASISPILNEKGQVTHFLAVKEDITEKKKMISELVMAKDKAEESESSFRSLFQNMIEGFAYCSMIFEEGIPVDFIYLEVNHAFEPLTGLKNVAGKRVSEVIPGIRESDPELLQIYGRVSSTGNPERFEMYLDSLHDWYSISVYCPQIGFFVAVFDVITDRKLTEQALQHSKEKAEESDRLKTAFLHNISHEIRTPLNAIIGFSEFLKNPALSNEKRDKFSTIIIQSSNQLLSIITDIISIATIEAGQEKIHEKQTNLNLVCDLIYQQFIDTATEKNLRMNISTSLSDSDALFITDETKLIQILSNLVGNALKFTKEGHVNFGYVVKDGEIEFYTEDTGIGIPENMHNEIFKRFRQVEFTATRHFGGSGLGLSISRAYVELLGGRIWLTSLPNQGSTFYFTLPVKKSSQPVRNLQTPAELPLEWSGKLNLLIAEDEDSNFTLLEELLAELNIHIIRAVNGRDAIDICMSTNIDLVLMDIKMPLLDGCEATRQIKQHKPSLPVVAQTAYTMIEEKERALRAGCDDYITKPIQMAELMKILIKYGRAV
jgi:PAS domain S-box-containing protein